jgi:hypothetical protein
MNSFGLCMTSRNFSGNPFPSLGDFSPSVFKSVFSKIQESSFSDLQPFFSASPYFHFFSILSSNFSHLKILWPENCPVTKKLALNSEIGNSKAHFIVFLLSVTIYWLLWNNWKSLFHLFFSSLILFIIEE